MDGKSEPVVNDFEGSDDDVNSGLRQEWGARREEFFNSGYREGIEAGKEGAVQQGFNAGYAAGSRAGFAWGATCGAVASLTAISAKLGVAARPQEDQRALAAAVAVPLKHAADAVLDEVMRQHAHDVQQQPASSEHNVGQQAVAGPTAGCPLSYQQLQERQQEAAQLLALQRGLQLQAELRDPDPVPT
ncbi:hypothetical protein N2152v2_006072 [Parachlorella kessleri]